MSGFWKSLALLLNVLISIESELLESGTNEWSETVLLVAKLSFRTTSLKIRRFLIIFFWKISNPLSKMNCCWSLAIFSPLEIRSKSSIASYALQKLATNCDSRLLINVRISFSSSSCSGVAGRVFGAWSLTNSPSYSNSAVTASTKSHAETDPWNPKLRTNPSLITSVSPN
ncbi:hypothetical protein OGAPHI_006239 [Ogataea philodendri]|uniref:Secreted protein n=1 Tax=Ogataea philodendri TaxID=1378263 RepID=A0A9P8T0S4_9ASCO|nr:uncharacterized protein OGAPHI_006239 [Ogataea philodendri]KAH3662058.1 hypothetical protein OGAPHI_006239 [Ogataea philodendri]